jgi:hypothetical protein
MPVGVNSEQSYSIEGDASHYAPVVSAPPVTTNA